MRLGGPVFVEGKDPEAYVAAHVQKGYRAAYCPGWINADTDPEICAAFRAALARHDLVLAEVGIWQNVLSHNRDEARAAMEYSVRRLQTAEELDARCAVNIVGSWCTTHWDGPHESHYSRDFFDAAVEAARKVIDAVKPKRTKMTFEVMPCQFIDSAAEYMRFLKAVDREAAGVHLDPANSIANPRILYGNGDFLPERVRDFRPGRGLDSPEGRSPGSVAVYREHPGGSHREGEHRLREPAPPDRQAAARHPGDAGASGHGGAVRRVGGGASRAGGRGGG